MAGFGAKEARIGRESRTQVNLCGMCGDEIGATELLCQDCRGTISPVEVEPEDEELRRTR